MARLNLFVLLLLTLIFTPARAEILVLVHGYLGSADSWEQSGINDILDANGWKRGGLLTASPRAAQFLVGPGKDAEKRVYVVDLPSQATIGVQTDNFIRMLETIRQTSRPGEPIIIVGHSAGGVVARMALVLGGAENVKALITIASPHVGTTLASEALDATDESGMFGPIKSFFGGNGYQTLRHSRGLLFDLEYPHPGSLLYWLNAQPHPDIKYVSVIRINPAGFAGDELVPGYSQDMNNVPSIRGKSSVFTTPTGHLLIPQDADTILWILNSIDQDEDKQKDTSEDKPSATAVVPRFTWRSSQS
jgi:pimeloyl-ACP methyl ester carboxylesterase